MTLVTKEEAPKNKLVRQRINVTHRQLLKTYLAAVAKFGIKTISFSRTATEI